VFGWVTAEGMSIQDFMMNVKKSLKKNLSLVPKRLNNDIFVPRLNICLYFLFLLYIRPELAFYLSDCSLSPVTVL
jgi:hypothetical protein